MADEPKIQKYRFSNFDRTLEPVSKGDWCKSCDVEAYVAAKVQAERERCRREEVEPLMDAGNKCLGMSYRIMQWAIKAVRKAQEDANRAGQQAGKEQSR